jgi:hypothetical protein
VPPIDENGGVRIDPIQLGEDLDREFGTSVFDLIESVAPSEVYLSSKALADTGASVEDVAAYIADYRYGANIGPYIRQDAMRATASVRTFAAVLPRRSSPTSRPDLAATADGIQVARRNPVTW